MNDFWFKKTCKHAKQYVVFVFSAMPEAMSLRAVHLSPLLPAGGEDVSAFLRACALMFVAYTGYGRIATTGEEIREPRRNIPRAP